MQDKSVVTLGQVMGTVLDKPYQNYIQNMFPKDNYHIILAVFNFEKKENWECNYQDVELEMVLDNYMQFGYRKGSARGGDVTFTTKAGNIEKKFKTFIKQIDAAIKIAKNLKNEEEFQQFAALKECVHINQQQIIEDLQSELENMNLKEQQKAGFSIRLMIDDEEKHVADFSTFQHLLVQHGTEGKSVKYKVRSESTDKTCSICLEEKSLIHGFASPFKYASVDKPGMVSGFFKQKNNWRNYPICADCAFDFEQGRDYVFQNLRKSFYGKPYFMIPQALTTANKSFLTKVTKTLSKAVYQPTEKEKNDFGAKEEFLMRHIAKEYGDKNRFTINLLFFEENPTTKAMKIKLALEEVLPTRFRKLFIEVPKEIEKNPIYKDAIYIKKEQKDLVFRFGIFKQFFEEDFYQIVQTIFLNIPLSKDLLYARFMKVIRANYNKKQSSDGYTEWGVVSVKKAHLILAYLAQLGIIILPKNTNKMEEKNLDLEATEVTSELEKKNAFNKEKFQTFLKENEGFLSKDIQKGLFGVGVLVRFLFNLQSANLDGNTPFEKKLHGYRLNPALVKKIYCEALEKIAQYTSFFSYRELRDFISENFTINSHHLSSMSNDELSFYFVAGLEMGNDFKNKTDKNK